VPSSAHPLAAHPHVGATRQGRLLRVDIPGTADHFGTRPAYVYVPSITRRHPELRLPVVVLLHGTPGGPYAWPTAGEAVATADAFAADHQGLAPIIVMPDINGTDLGDTECIRTPSGGDVEHYLQVTLPQWVIAHVPADPDRRHWAVAGLSEGGTCAAMLALSEPGNWAAFASLSGLAHPTQGRGDSPLLAERVLFGGSAALFDAHDPLWLAAHRHYSGLSAWIFCASDEHVTCGEQRQVAAATRAAGVRTDLVVALGTHRWTVWAAAFRKALPWLWSATAG
jgi:S-formylglutathione hydrolase FrmB